MDFLLQLYDQLGIYLVAAAVIPILLTYMAYQGKQSPPSTTDDHTRPRLDT